MVSGCYVIQLRTHMYAQISVPHCAIELLKLNDFVRFLTSSVFCPQVEFTLSPYTFAICTGDRIMSSGANFIRGLLVFEVFSPTR
jgi:hypothetical protein